MLASIKKFMTLDTIVLAMLLSFMVGVMTALSAKYPVEVASLEAAKKLCAPYEARVIKSQLTGTVNYVECKDGRKFEDFD